jgi:hypothetical protein
MSFDSDIGNIDLLKIKIDSDVIKRRFPSYFVLKPDLTGKRDNMSTQTVIPLFYELLDDLKKNTFMLSSNKDELNGRRLQYLIHASEVDLTNHVSSDEFKQVKLLLYCVDFNTKSEFRKGEESKLSSPDREESTIIPTKKIDTNEAYFFKGESILSAEQSDDNSNTSMDCSSEELITVNSNSNIPDAISESNRIIQSNDDLSADNSNRSKKVKKTK